MQGLRQLALCIILPNLQRVPVHINQIEMLCRIGANGMSAVFRCAAHGLSRLDVRQRKRNFPVARKRILLPDERHAIFRIVFLRVVRGLQFGRNEAPTHQIRYAGVIGIQFQVTIIFILNRIRCQNGLPIG